MIFDEMTLHNFGAYYGKQTIELKPKSSKKPIVLIGGYNGAGKTTLFDAFQLVLFGKLANSISQKDLPYEKYLKQVINKYTPQREGAKISLTFRHKSDGVKNTYKINRSWYSNGKGTNEKVEVFLNGLFDKVMSESWAEIVEDFIPLEISKLFFFDGEKIKELAEQKKTSQIISTGLYSLLGLHLIDKLNVDLNILKRKKAIPLKSEVEKNKINEIQTEVTNLDQQRNIRKIKITVTDNNVKQLEKELKEQEKKFKNAGGDFYNLRYELQNEKSIIEYKINELYSQMLDLASSPIPLVLVKPLLKAIQKKDKKEYESVKSKALLETLEKKDTNLINFLKRQDSSKNLISEIDNYLIKERKIIEKKLKIKSYHNLSESTRSSISHLLESIIPGLISQNKKYIKEYDELQSRLLNINRKLAMVPMEESIIEYISTIEKTKAILNKKKNELKVLKEQYRMTCNNHEAKQKNLTKEIEKTIEEKFENESNRRIIEYSGSVQKKIRDFKVVMVRSHIDRIQKFILESIKQLFRKKSFIESFIIDPVNFNFDLFDRQGDKIYLHQLSAGEKQLVVTSILWGLAKSSDFPLPAIIDTPLGRLDSTHRQRIIDGYFPFASHQVILLSTDEEISEEYLKKLSPWISHSYILNYNDENESTSLAPGYFRKAS